MKNPTRDDYLTSDQPAAAAPALLETFEATVRQQPLLAMGAVIGVGFLVGIVLTKGSRPPRRLKSLQDWAGTDIRSRDLEKSIDRLERFAGRTAPRAYEGIRESVSNLPDMISTMMTAWQTKAASKIDQAKAAIPEVADIKTAASNAAKKWAS